MNNPLSLPKVGHVQHNLNYIGGREIATRRKIVRKGQKQERRMAVAECMNLKLANDIREYLATNAMPGQTFILPQSRPDYKLLRDDLWTDHSTGEIMTDREAFYLPLIRTYYALFSNYHKGAKRTLGKVYLGDGGEVATTPLMIATSRHKLNHVWNFYKSQIIRRKYLKLLQDWDADGILRNYNPVHITLTVPRDKDGNFKGNRFFGPDLLYYFNLMRKEKWWGEMVFAGEFGLETKKGKTIPGYHIHIHSFALLHADYKVNALRKKIAEWWLRHTGGKLIGVETLYVTERHSNGKPVYEYVYRSTKSKNIFRCTPAEYKAMKPTFDAEGKVFKKEKKKRYVDPATSPIADYLGGVMECIKYHFKPDMFLEKYTRADGTKAKRHDIPAILEVLKGTHNKRLYSKYGMFYKIKELALGYKDDGQAVILTADEFEGMDHAEYFANATTTPSIEFLVKDYEAENITAEMDAELRDIQIDTTALGGGLPTVDVNPYTLAAGDEADGWPVLYNVNNRKHADADYYNTFDLSPYTDTDISQFIFLKQDVEINEIIKLMALGKANPASLKNKGLVDETMKQLQDNLVYMLNATKAYFKDGPGLAVLARRHAMEYIANNAEFRIYTPDILHCIRDYKAKVEKGIIQCPGTYTNNYADRVAKGEIKPYTPEKTVYYLTADTFGSTAADTQPAPTAAGRAMQGWGMDTTKALNLKGRLKMQEQQQRHYLRTIGFKVEVSTWGVITKIER